MSLVNCPLSGEFSQLDWGLGIGDWGLGIGDWDFQCGVSRLKKSLQHIHNL
ncbi:MAG: hypothetical protein HEQ35_21455 [Gloeotrichia echinulata IR180]